MTQVTSSRRQLALAQTSLRTFKESHVSRFHDITYALQRDLRPYIASMPQDQFQCAFGHLTGYVRVIMAIMAKVYAVDLLNYIQDTVCLIRRLVGLR